jgi:hypothetical protein
MAKRKLVLGLHIHDVFTSTMTMTREQKGLFLELMLMYANGIEIPANPNHASKHAPGASIADLAEVLGRFKRMVHENAEDNDAFGPRIYDQRIEPLHLSNRDWRW